MRSIYLLMLLGPALVLAEQSVARKPDPSAIDWEREASQWALATYQESLRANQKEYAEHLSSLRSIATDPLPTGLLEEHRERGFITFFRPYQHPIQRSIPPQAEEAKVDRLALRIARNEWELLRIGIWTLREIEDFSFSISPPVHSDGEHVIELAQSVRLYYGFNMMTPKRNKGKKKREPSVDGTAAGEALIESKFREAPAALLDLATMDFPANESHGLWVDVHVPSDAQAGEYSSTVVLAIKGRTVAEIPLTISVYPLVLDEASAWGRGAYLPHLARDDLLIQMRVHELNVASWWTRAGYELRLRNGEIEADFGAYARYLERLDRYGYIRKHVVFLGGASPKLQNIILGLLGRRKITDARNPKNARTFLHSDLSEPFGTYLVQTMKQFHQQMSRAGHPELAACLLDEPDHRPRPERRNWYNRMFAMVEKGAPEVPLYGTFYHAGDEDRLSWHHAVWTTNRPAKRIATMAKRAGAELRTYGVHGNYNRPIGSVRFRFGIIPWVFGAQGTYFWAQYWHKGEPFDPFSMKVFSTASLPTPHGPLASIALKGIREAIDDRRYLMTLENLIAKALQGDNQALRVEAKRHQAFLNSFRDPLFDRLIVAGGHPRNLAEIGPIRVTGVYGRSAWIGGSESSTWAFVDFVRHDVAKRIVSLQRALESGG